MASRSPLLQNILTSNLAWVKCAIILMISAIPLGSQAKPSGFGEFVLDDKPKIGIASGTYTTPQGATGKFTITRNVSIGYSGQTIQGGKNGVQIQNNATTDTNNDKFEYLFTIEPHEAYKDLVHTIKIGQASYADNGNSEIARQTLKYTNNSRLPSILTKAFIETNSVVPYYYGAMGDYFMGSKINDTQLSSQNPSIDTISGQQLRIDSSNGQESAFYYYKIPNLTGSGNSNPYTPSLTSPSKYVSLKTSNNGALPDNPTFEKIFKKLVNDNSYAGLTTNTTIPNGGKYVSYGIENSKSTYVIAVKNASDVTLTYEGIMKGSEGLPGPVIGETYIEWISFGVESEPIPNYIFTGTVFNDNGGLTLEANKLGTVNSQYFNGTFDPLSGEVGISNANLAVRLTDCSAEDTLIPTTLPQAITDTGIKKGQYSFSVSSSALQNRTKVCIIQVEPGNWEYSVDSTTNKREVTLNTGVYNYNNLDFGEVQANNTALVLIKSQYIHDCSLESLTKIRVNYDDLPTDAYSTTVPAASINPGQCIAYRIEAVNRGNVTLTDIIISDPLQVKDIKNGILVTSTLTNPIPISESTGNPTFSNDSVAINNNGKVITNGFSLKPQNRSAIRFNTKYGTTVDP